MIVVDFWADPDRLRAVAPQFAQLGDDVEAALKKLQQGIASEGPCWGGDKPGQEFQKKYPQGDGPGGTREALAALAKLADTLRATGDKITGSANAAQAQDQHSADQIRRV
ncbi:WXG100 family type VII secretion target [Nocardia terpenica]|uniref:WXG100 family type VII secretion target n=1 Tax=Nocardia terpenica TaxID=455432 RepID=A0A6G9YYL2_9NOCA|nr:hypothetical protein [Nocardia terpenica]QIS18260.1 hypothetical protein F6W96_08185 [Nocardia terpenica]